MVTLVAGMIMKGMVTILSRGTAGRLSKIYGKGDKTKDCRKDKTKASNLPTIGPN